MRSYYYALLRKYISLFVLDQNSVLEIDPTTPLLIASMPQGKVAFRNTADTDKSSYEFSRDKIVNLADVKMSKPDYLVLGGLVHYERDVQGLLKQIRALCSADTRLIITYYSSLWRPLATLASTLGIRQKTTELNWLAHEDVANLLTLEDFELIRLEQKILIPFYLPIVSQTANRYIAPLPFFRNFCLLNIALARPITKASPDFQPSVSTIIPARNEAGHIDDIVKRIPQMGPQDEIIFIEGNSTDDTWRAIQNTQTRYRGERRILIGQQNGKGKGDAVRMGFSMATRDILMILDADMTVPPEDLPKFYNAIKGGKGEFINGTRLVYPMEKKAMRFFNLLANKFFALAFSFILGQRYKDTLCGTKVISRENYLRLKENRSYFGNFDPFGDFDLIFGAARMGLKIIEVPITYRERVYGETNISRWRHGAILIRMVIFAARKIKFI
jgi:Glycosyl transferase family 2